MICLRRYFVMLSVFVLSVSAGFSAEKTAYETATLAGGCFWCVQEPFDKTSGVISTVVGYTGGQKANPKYKEVASGRTRHQEAMQVVFDPAQISYKEILDVFWRTFDPTDNGGQFADRGPHYKPGIFYHDEDQKKVAEVSKKALNDSGRFRKPVVTEIVPASTFYPAEDYHQKYYLKNPGHYYAYKAGSGRAGFLRRTWGKDK